MLKHVGIYLPLPIFPLTSSVWHFPDPCHLTSLFQLLKGIDNIWKVIDCINKSLLFKYFILSMCKLFTRVQLVI